MRSKRTTPPVPKCKAAMKWLSYDGEELSPDAERRAHGRAALAALTGSDWRAITAFAHLVELYSVSSNRGHVLVAMRATALCLQRKCRVMAKELIAEGLDWSDRERLWTAMGFRA